CFMSTRKRSGGYHAKTPLRCLLTSIAIEIIVFKIIAPFLMPQHIFWSLALLGFAITTFCTVGTVNHPSMHLSQLEVNESKKRLLLIAGFESITIILILVLFDTLRQQTLYMAIGLACAAASTIIAKAVGQEVKQGYGKEA
ncbi:MAG: accessory gene regulator B family protein, partial [Oscillospiraceae bacterium]